MIEYEYQLLKYKSYQNKIDISCNRFLRDNSRPIHEVFCFFQGFGQFSALFLRMPKLFPSLSLLNAFELFLPRKFGPRIPSILRLWYA